jgi:hypothetical protein
MPRPSSIPRLQEVAFLTDAMLAAVEGQTFDQIRLTLVDKMELRRSATELTGNHAGVRRRGADDDEFGYLHNATEALAELMRLGYLDKQPLPSSRTTLEAHRGRTFEVTESGIAWADTLRAGRLAEGYDELFGKLWRQHPQLADFLRILQAESFVVPTAQWSEAALDDPTASLAARRSAYVDFLSERCARAMAVEALGWSASVPEIREGIKDYVTDRMRSAESRGRPDPYPRGQDFVGACEEALVKFALRRAGIKMDYISLEIVRRWCRDLGVASFSYHVPTRPALTMWATARITEQGSVVNAMRRTTPGDEQAVIDGLAESFQQARRHERSDFVAIYLVRAWACHALRVSETTFDRALARCLDGDAVASGGFRVHLDPAQYRPVPPTERAFIHNGQHFYSMTLVATKDRTTA